VKKVYKKPSRVLEVKMRKAIMIMMILLGITLVIATNEQINSKKECKKVCIANFKSLNEGCTAVYSEGKNFCKQVYNICKDDTRTLIKECKDAGLDKLGLRTCIKEGGEEYRQCSKSHNECDKTSRTTFLGCLREVKTGFESCKMICKDRYMSEKECKGMGGTWNPCSSPCEGNGEICIQTCEPRCEFKPCDTAEDCRDVGLKRFNCINKRCIRDP